jgi:hypothetical protein
VLVAILVGAGIIDRKARPQTTARVAGRNLDSLMPTAASSRSLTSAWYCPAATSSPNGPADGTLIMANPGDSELTATLTLVPVNGEPKAVPLTVPANARVVIHEADYLQAPHVAALVDFNGGGGVVEQMILGPAGTSTTACSSEASDHWYFPTGSTDRDWTQSIYLFNPFPGDAIVDLNFATDQGPSAPPDFQGVVVPARGLQVLDIGEHVRRRVDVATTVTARSGRVVAGQIVTHTSAPTALLGTLGAPSTGPLWVFPDGLAAPGVAEQYHIYNPAGRDAAVTVELTLDQGEAEPFDLTIPAHSSYILDANGEARIPKGVAHAATVRSTNGVGVVAQRTVVATSPSPHTGTSAVLGARTAARDWILAAGAAVETVDEWVVVLNPSTKATTVSVTALASGVPLPVEGLQDVDVPAGARVALRLGDHISRADLALALNAGSPVYVERDLFWVKQPLISATIGIPAAPGG